MVDDNLNVLEAAIKALHKVHSATMRKKDFCAGYLYLVMVVLKHEERVKIMDRPTVVCICGSTRFVEQLNEWRKRLTIEGKIVLSPEIVTTQSEREDPQWANRELKLKLDQLHLHKIDLADEIFVLNVDDYIGESTRSEIIYAHNHGKPVKFLEQTVFDWWNDYQIP